MADNKQYITQVQENGTLHISEDVIAAIAARALSEVDGVFGLSAKNGSDRIAKKSKGVKIAIGEDNKLSIDCNIIVFYGQSVVDVAKAAQSVVANAISAMTGVDISVVNINVCGIARQ